MDIRPIRNEADLDWAINEVSAYFENQPEPGTPEADRFDLLSDLIEAYEEKHHPIEAPDPVEFIKAIMEGRGFSKADLGRVLGSAPRASELLSRRRALNLRMVREINRAWGVPVEPLIEPYHLDGADEEATKSKKVGRVRRARKSKENPLSIKDVLDGAHEKKTSPEQTTLEEWSALAEEVSSENRDITLQIFKALKSKEIIGNIQEDMKHLLDLEAKASSSESVGSVGHTQSKQRIPADKPDHK